MTDNFDLVWFLHITLTFRFSDSKIQYYFVGKNVNLEKCGILGELFSPEITLNSQFCCVDE